MDHPLPSTIIMLQISCLSASQPGRSRISQTVGCQPLYFGQKPIIWQDFCRKLRENERNWSKRGRGSLDRPMTNTYHWRIQGGGARDARPPGGPNSFIFMQFSAKIWKIIAILRVGAPPGENPGSATAYELLFTKTTHNYPFVSFLK